MSPFQCNAAVLIAGLLGGCASAPEQITANPAQVATEADEKAIVAEGAALEPVVLELDVRDLDPGLVVTCRDMLQPNSNTLRMRCMTRDDWKRFEREEARQAEQTVRRMQGDPLP